MIAFCQVEVQGKIVANENTTYPHTAITSWSGFVYQGKVAIYHVLKLLNESEIYYDHILRLEYFDDFEILDSSENVVSVHQVKAWKAQTYSSYREAFQKLKEKAVNNNEAEKHFHVANEIINKTKDEIESEYSPVKIYMYDHVSYCPVGGNDGIDKKIEQLLNEWFRKYFPDDNTKHLPIYSGRAREYIDQIVLKKVLNIHQKIHEDENRQDKVVSKETINFSEFREILQQDDLMQKDINDNEDYWLYIVIGDLHRYCQNFCYEHEEELTTEERVKLSWCMSKIEKLAEKKQDMINFLSSIQPQKKFSCTSSRDYKEYTPNSEEIEDTFMDILRELKTPEFISNKFFRWYLNGKSFAPTTISLPSHKVKIVCEKILKNNSDESLLFDYEKLITSDITTTSSIFEEARKIVTDKLNPTNILNWKNVSLVSLEKAKGEINAGNHK